MSPTRGSRLLRHDGRILANALRATFRPWHDRLTAAVAILLLLAGLRSGLGDQAWSLALWIAGAAGFMSGLLAGRSVAMRLAFHAADGVLAADALRGRERRHYAVAWQAVGLGALAIVTLAVRPALLIVTLPAYLAGALIGHASRGVGLSALAMGRARLGRAVLAWLRRPAAGMAGAVVLILAAAGAAMLGEAAMLPFIGVVTVLLVLALTTVDDGAVRFMTLSGHGAWRIVARHSRSLLLLLAVAVPALWLGLGGAAAALAGGLAGVGWLLMTLRILAYRLYGKRLADLFVSAAAGMLAFLTLTLPLLLPVMAGVILWRLHRDASPRTWLIE